MRIAFLNVLLDVLRFIVGVYIASLLLVGTYLVYHFRKPYMPSRRDVLKMLIFAPVAVAYGIAIVVFWRVLIPTGRKVLKIKDGLSRG
jgi:hypothetical protein